MRAPAGAEARSRLHRGAVARVAQPRGRHRPGVDGAERERLLELRRARDDLAVLVDRHAVAVEDELVLAADHVAEQHRGEVVARALDEHPLALGALARVVGRGREVHDHLGAGERLGGGGRPGLPDVLADREADGHAVQLEAGRRIARLEVALLVEHPVVGQVHLAVDRRHLAVGEHGGGVVDVVGALREPDQRDDPARRGASSSSAARGASRKCVFSSRSSGG